MIWREVDGDWRSVSGRLKTWRVGEIRLTPFIRFATEMAGRKVRIKGFGGLARAMENVGWFNDM